MGLAGVLVALLAATPVQIQAGDDLARTYFSESCADGNERFAAYVPQTGVLHDITVSGTSDGVDPDDAKLRALCHVPAFIAYHCHPSNDRLSLFPGLSFDDNSSDFGAVAYLEYVCASEVDLPTSIEYRLVHSGGEGDIVGYGLRGALLERARSLGKQSADVTTTPDEVRVDRYGIPDMRSLLQAPKQFKVIHNQLESLYDIINEQYGSSVLGFIKKQCPGVTTKEGFASCDAFTLQAYIEAADPCADWYIVPPGADKPRACDATAGERISLGGPRYPGWTELTPATYETYTGEGKAAVAFCSDIRGNTMGRPCSVVLSEATKVLPSCGQLKRGFVDIARHPKLRGNDDAYWREIILLDRGERYDIKSRHMTGTMYTLIVCGPEVLFGQFTIN